MSPDRQLLTALAALRRQWRQRVLLESLVWIVVAIMLAVLASMAVVRMFGGPDADGAHVLLNARLTGYALIIAAIVRGLIVPLLRRASDERFAMYVEERAPTLRQALLTAVQEAHVPEADRVSPSLSARLMTRATGAIRPLQVRASLERPRMMRAGQWLVGLALVSASLFMLAPAFIRDGARLLFVPWSTAEAAVPRRLVTVEPGNASVPRGGAIEMHAVLVGFAADGAELVFRSDSASEWTRIPMSRDADSTGFRARLFDLTKRTEYFVESADVRSPTFALRITDLPAVSHLSLDLRFPAYSGLPAEHIEDGGDVAAIIGTTVVVHAKITRAVKAGQLHFDDGSVVPLMAQGDSVVTGAFPVKRSGFYRVDLQTIDGTMVAGAVQYVVDAIPDRAPTVRIEEPGRDTKVTNTDEVTIAVRASDDLGVTKMELRYRVNGGEEKHVAIQDSTTRRPRDARGTHTLFLEELNLTPGDLVTYYAVARDGAGHEGSSDVYFLDVRPFTKNYKQAEQQGGGGGAGGPQPDSPDGFVQREKDVVAGTFNWLRDSSTTAAKKRRDDITTLTIAQGRLREDVSALAKRLVDRGVATTDSTFAKIQKELETASTEMKSAEEQLGRGLGATSLPSEQKALQHLQRAEALYRDVQVQMGGGGGGGGGGGAQQRPEELADLFELQTDKLRNQYEAVQQQSSSQPQGQRDVDETLERLKQLANRQQQENERLQKMAEAMRQRLSQDGGSNAGAQRGSQSGAQGGGQGGSQGGANGGSGGNSGAQRELAKQAEKEARRLERLSREQNNPELADAARQMQQAADAMRRAATGSAAQGNQALEELNRATRKLEGARTDATNSGIQKLAQQAKEMEARQQEIAGDVEKAQAAAGASRDEQMRQLMARKDALAKDVAKLEAEADKLSRDGKRDQPKAASKLGDAAEAIRDSRLKDKIEFSKNVMRGGSAEYAKAFEGQIGENLKDVADRVGAAAGSMQGESAARAQEKALGQTRELVQNLEALKQRLEGGQRAGRGNTGATPQQGGAPTMTTGGGMPTGAPTGGSRGQLPAGDIQQFTREFRLRRENAEALRNQVAQQGLNTRELDRAIDNLRQLENSKVFNDPKALSALQSAMIEGLKTFEFGLYRSLGLGSDGRPALGANAPVPAEYRALIEEYYRSLAVTGNGTTSTGKKKPN